MTNPHAENVVRPHRTNTRATAILRKRIHHPTHRANVATALIGIKNPALTPVVASGGPFWEWHRSCSGNGALLGRFLPRLGPPTGAAFFLPGYGTRCEQKGADLPKSVE